MLDECESIDNLLNQGHFDMMSNSKEVHQGQQNYDLSCIKLDSFKVFLLRNS